MNQLETSTSALTEVPFLSFGVETQVAGDENKKRLRDTRSSVAVMAGAALKTRTWIRVIHFIPGSSTEALVPDEDERRETNLQQQLEYYNRQISLCEKEILSKTTVKVEEFIQFTKLKEEIYMTLPPNIIKEDLEERLFEIHLHLASLDPIRYSTGLLKGMGSTEDLLKDRRLERERERLF